MNDSRQAPEAVAPDPTAAALRAEEARLDAALARCEIVEPDPPLTAPRVTVLVSLYQAEEFVYQCLGDLVAQTIFPRLDVVVVDAASPQRERLVVAHYQKKHPNFRYVRTPSRIGIYAAWNLGVRLARGDCLTTFSANDRLLPRGLEILLQALDAEPAVALAYGDSYISYDPRADEAALRRKPFIDMFKWPPYSYEDLLTTNRVGPHPLWRKSVHAELGPFDESLTALGDQDYWLRLGRRHALKHTEAVTGIYFRSKDALSAGETADREFVEIRRRYRKLHEEERRQG